jgi:CotH kinase protein/Chitobiase/beta-hexosaminidase C-terminal domain
VAPSDVVDPPNAPVGAFGFSVPSGTFEGSLMVTITGTEPGVEVRYTTDGTLPTPSASLYDGAALTLTETTQLRAQQFVAGAPSDFVISAIYIRRTFDVSSDIPLVIMEAYGGGKPPTDPGPEKVVYRDLAFMLFEPVDGVAALSAPPTWASRAGYHVRGQSSASFDKTPYRVELWDENNEDVDRPMIGMPQDSDWAMIGEYSDKTLVRNAFSFSLATAMGLKAPQMRFAEVYINQAQGPLEATHYEGVYAITETIKNNASRLDLAQLEPEDTMEAQLSGGYIFKFDLGALREDEGEIEILCTGNEDTCFDDLELTDPVEPNAEQLAWIGDYVSQAHASLIAEPVGDYAQYLDVVSFVDLLVLNELTKGGDKYVRSVYLHKDRDGLITAGPAWDFNFTLGNLVSDVEGWQVDGGRDYGANWFELLFAQPEIRAAMAARWAELRQDILSDAELEARIDSVAAPIVNAGPRDLERWPVTGGGVFGGGFGGPGGGMDADAGQEAEVPATWEGHIDSMKQWIRQRTAWLDAEYATF